MKRLLLPALALLATAPLTVRAASDDDIERTYKLSVGQYRYRGDPDDTGHDVNLRWQRDDLHLWGGFYEERTFGRQWRGGVDNRWSPLDGLSVQPSLQVASGGFVGGSVLLQIGSERWFGLVGWGRTNLRPYFNLNFDPNDAVTLGAGWHGDGGRSITATWIADDRLHTGQRHAHLIAQWPTGERQRLTLDLLHKRGEGDAGPVHAWGWTATYDAPGGWFVRCARDPKQNFSEQDALRLSLGTRW